MKRLIFTLALALIISLCFSLTPVSPVLSTFPYGIEIVDMDGNGDQKVDTQDFVMFSRCFGTIKGDKDYSRRWDFDFDDDIDSTDQMHLAQCIFDELDLVTIRNEIKTSVTETLEWSQGGWTCPLVQLTTDHAKVRKFTGADAYQGDVKGWITVHRHPWAWDYPDGMIYICQHFAEDTARASYKALGYGCILRASSDAHAYNIFWVGGDWTDLNNWYMLEPQTGGIANAANPDLPDNWKTTQIYFPTYTDSHSCHHHLLDVDFDEATVSPSDEDYGRPLANDQHEEPLLPDYTFEW